MEKLKQKIIRIILSDKGDELKPNSYQSIEGGGHHICVSKSEKSESSYRVWNWNDYIMLYNEEKGLFLKYIYDNYFQRL